MRKSGVTLAPVIDLKSKKDDEDSNSNSSFGNYNLGKVSFSDTCNFHMGITFRFCMTVDVLLQCWQDARGIPRDTEWNFEGEYDPMWPNDYEKVVKGETVLR